MADYSNFLASSLGDSAPVASVLDAEDEKRDAASKTLTSEQAAEARARAELGDAYVDGMKKMGIPAWGLQGTPGTQRALQAAQAKMGLGLPAAPLDTGGYSRHAVDAALDVPQPPASSVADKPALPPAPPVAPPAAPMAVTAPKPAPQVSVGTSAPLDPSGMVDSLKKQGPGPEALAVPPAPAAAPSGDDELAKAQALARSEANKFQIGGLLDRAGRTMIGSAPDNAPFEQGAAQAQQGVKDLLARREALRQANADAQQKALTDPNSEPSKLATMIARSRGLIPPGQSIAASQWNLIKDAGSMQEATDRLNAARLDRESQRSIENARLAEESRHNKVSEATSEDKVQAMLERAQGKQGLKPMDAQTVEKHSGAEPGAQAIADAMQDFDKVGGFGLVGGDSAKYKNTMTSRALAAAIARNPLARESLNANSEHLADTYMPSPSATKATAADKLADQMTGIERGLKSRIEDFRSAGVDPSPLEHELERLQPAKERFYKTANKYLPGAKRYHAPHPEDDQAVSWAKANPTDPRAAAIIQANSGN